MVDKRYTLLVVDDDVSILEMIQAMLRGTPFRVVTASSGSQALSEADSGQPDIVLLDIMIPDVSGIAICGQLRSNTRYSQLPIVMLTALNDYPTRRQAMQAGADDLLTKPVGKNELLSKLMGVIAERGAGMREMQWTG